MISSQQILAICAMVTSIWAVWKIVKEINKPNDELKEKVEQHTKALDNDNRRLKELESDNKMILQALLVIVNHEITGNGIENMKNVRDELQDYLIKR